MVIYFYRWVFRGITRGNPIETLWKFEKNKSKATFINAIDRRLKSNSTISTDSQRAYFRKDKSLFEEHIYF